MLVALGDVLDVGDRVAQGAVAGPHGGDVGAGPHGGSIGTHDAQLGGAAVEGTLGEPEEGVGEQVAVVGVDEAQPAVADDLVDRSAHELGVGGVDLEVAPVGRVQRHAEGGVVEGQPEALLGVEQGFEFGVDERVRTLALRRALEADVRIAPIRSFLDEPVTKLIVRFPTDAPPGRSEAVQAVVGDRALVTRSMSEVFLELSHPDVHKAAAVERLLAEHGAPPESVVAFGDMPNDVELIRWAGLGVAVANAHPELLAAADEVTASNDDDGVALVIERILAEA